MNSDCYVDKLKACTSDGQLMDVGSMQPKEYFQLIHPASIGVIHENIDKADPLSKQVCGHSVNIVSSIVTFQDLCAALQVMLRTKYIMQIEIEKGDTTIHKAPVLKASVNVESSEVMSKQVICHLGEMIDFKCNGANGMHSGNQVHSEMGKVDYSSQGESILRASIKIEEDEKQKTFDCYSSDIKVNTVCNINKDMQSNSSSAKEITSDINTVDTFPSVFPQSISPNDFVGGEFHDTLERSSLMLTELKVNTVMKYIHEECNTESIDKVNAIEMKQKHVDDLIFSDSKCMNESHENEHPISSSQILNCKDTLSGSNDAKSLTDCCESVQNSRVCQKIKAEVAEVNTHEAANCRSISANKSEKNSDVDSESDPLSVTNLVEKLKRPNKDFEGKKKHKDKDLGVKPESLLTCIGCEETFQVRSKLKEHCKTCDIYLIIKKQQRSKSEKKSVKTYNTKCILCDIVFPSRYRLKQHEIQVHGGALRKVGIRDETKVFRCKECTTSFHTNEELTNHKEFPAYVCQHCGAKKCSLLRLIQHEKTHTHILKYPGPHQCRICNKILSTKGNLKAHEMEHAGIRKFVCELCGKAFPSNRGLQSHKISVHTDERPFICTQCDSAFKFERNLREHSRVHTGVKPFSCDECGKLFRHSSSLREHRMIHTKPFKCDFCDKRFQTQHNLSEHVNSHDAVNYEHL